MNCRFIQIVDRTGVDTILNIEKISLIKSFSGHAIIYVIGLEKPFDVDLSQVSAIKKRLNWIN